RWRHGQRRNDAHQSVGIGRPGNHTVTKASQVTFDSQDMAAQPAFPPVTEPELEPLIHLAVGLFDPLIIWLYVENLEFIRAFPGLEYHDIRGSSRFRTYVELDDWRVVIQPGNHGKCHRVPLRSDDRSVSPFHQKLYQGGRNSPPFRLL